MVLQNLNDEYEREVKGKVLKDRDFFQAMQKLEITRL